MSITHEGGSMYPQVTQFETRAWLFAQQLELLRAREIAAGRADAKPRLRRFGIIRIGGPVTQQEGQHAAQASR